MAGAFAMSGAGYALARQFRGPMVAAQYLWPTRSDIDRPLVTGVVLFGIGWGLGSDFVRALHWKTSQPCRRA